MADKQDLGLGKIIKGDAFRDAIHIAVCPIECGEQRLEPGEHVSAKNGKAVIEANLTPIGIVDPYLKKPVKHGERFWLFLYPNTITTLRHDWTHPDLPAEDHVEKLLEAIDGQALRKMGEIADRIGMDRDELVAGLTEYIERNEWIHRGDNESYNDLSQGDRNDMWEAWQKITGKKAPADKFGDGPFSCAC